MAARKHRGIHDIQQRRWSHSSRVKLPFVNMSASLFLVSNIFDLYLDVQIDSVEQPIKSNSVGS